MMLDNNATLSWKFFSVNQTGTDLYYPKSDNYNTTMHIVYVLNHMHCYFVMFNSNQFSKLKVGI